MLKTFVHILNIATLYRTRNSISVSQLTQNTRTLQGAIGGLFGLVFFKEKIACITRDSRANPASIPP